ncbi:hypothetical protein RJT34_20661 [Clitoria ternatea]|uniref:Uncharacterized protein n=1 Tax=Clitoria ternatea TaxID=43366 RepID=A0AAN9ITA5_CLITE
MVSPAKILRRSSDMAPHKLSLKDLRKRYPRDSAKPAVVTAAQPVTVVPAGSQLKRESRRSLKKYPQSDSIVHGQTQGGGEGVESASVWVEV